MYVYNLVLEITRKCNLKCAHCLRGCAQRLTMSNEVLGMALSNISSINCLTITGGEPSLAPEVLKELHNQLLWRRINVEYFYITSNGMSHNRYGKFLKAVDRLMGIAEDIGSCSLDISRDQYHQYNNSMTRLFEKYMKDDAGYPYYEAPEYFHPEARTKDIAEAINEGRAVETQVGVRPPELQKPWVVNEDNDVVEEEVYISASGNVVSCCDMSFKRIDKETKGNILTQSLQDIVNGFKVNEAMEA